LIWKIKYKTVGAVGMRETRSVFQGLWAAVENRRVALIATAMAVFPPLFTTRHFHGAPGVLISRDR
jgi:hypothetical protein